MTNTDLLSLAAALSACLLASWAIVSPFFPSASGAEETALLGERGAEPAKQVTSAHASVEPLDTELPENGFLERKRVGE